MNRYLRRHPVNPFLPISYPKKERIPDLHNSRKKVSVQKHRIKIARKRIT